MEKDNTARLLVPKTLRLLWHLDKLSVTAHTIVLFFSKATI